MEGVQSFPLNLEETYRDCAANLDTSQNWIWLFSWISTASYELLG